MRAASTVVGLLAISVCAWGKGADAPASKPAVAVVRDLALVPPGTYRMVQAWEMTGTETNQHGNGAKTEKTKLASSNRFSFAAEVKAPGNDIAVTVNRVEARVDEGDKSLVYDSDGPVEQQAEILYRQFHGLVGRTARAGAATFSVGRGFVGLDTAWDKSAVSDPDLTELVRKMNRNNYGDARLDRMFTQGLALLYGADAGRAKGKSRELREGDKLKATWEEPGIAMKPTMVEHACKVLSANPAEVVVRSEWKINGFDPQVQSGRDLMRGGDIHGVATFTFLPRGGLLTHLEEKVERTDQSAPGRSPGVIQWTMESTERKMFSLEKESPPGSEASVDSESRPPAMQATMAAMAFAEVTGTEKLRKATHDALMGLSFIKFDLEKRRSPDENIKQVLAIGPLACTAVLGRYREANLRELKTILHQLLVDLRGRDLGAKPDAWQDWCNTIVRESLSKP